jgi:hypothetical protein
MRQLFGWPGEGAYLFDSEVGGGGNGRGGGGAKGKKMEEGEMRKKGEHQMDKEKNVGSKKCICGVKNIKKQFTFQPRTRYSSCSQAR